MFVLWIKKGRFNSWKRKSLTNCVQRNKIRSWLSNRFVNREKVVIELKTVEFLTDVHTAEILTYMKLGNYKLGLLLNFNVKLLKEGIRRFIL